MSVRVEELREAARTLLAEGRVRRVVGWRRGPDPLCAAPVFLSRPEEAYRLVWDPTCVQNLARFLQEERERRRRHGADALPIALFVKGCDSRAVNVLLQERFIARGDVHLLGVSCEEGGMVDPARVRARAAGREVESVAFAEGGAVALALAGGETLRVPAEEVLAARCAECRVNHPVVADRILGEKVPREPAAPYGSLAALEAMAPAARAAFWTERLSRCLRCSACRSVCPMCFCTECVVDTIGYAASPRTSADEKAERIRWIERSNTPADNFGFHLVRAIHLAGRCIDCGECSRVCPVGIPVRLLHKKLEKSARELFGHTAGMTAEGEALASSFGEGDPGDWIR